MSTMEHSIDQLSNPPIEAIERLCDKYPKAITRGSINDLIEPFVQVLSSRPEAVRLMVFGEFNAGKSTLINALVGRVVCGVDVMEKTSVVTRYFESPSNLALVHKRDGAMLRLELTEPIVRCLDAAIASVRATEIRRLDVGLPGIGNLVVIDTPGIGSRSPLNTAAAVSALKDADAVLYCLPLDALGGSRDIGTLRDLRGLGYPLILAVTRADLAESPNELIEVQAWIESALAVGRDSIGFVGGLHDGGMPTGLRELQQMIQNLARQSTPARVIARAANCKRMGLAIASWGHGLRSLVTNWRDAAQEAQALVVETGQLIEDRIKASLEADVESKLFNAHQSDCISSIGTTTEQSRAAIQRLIADGASNMVSGLADQVVENWKALAPKLTLQLESIGQDARISASKILSQSYDINAIHQDITCVQRNATADALGMTAVVAATGVGISTLAGAALGLAVTGIGLPIAAVGAAVSVMIGRSAAHRRNLAIQLEVQDYIRALKDAFRTEILYERILPDLHRLNLEVVRRLDDDFISKTTPFTTRVQFDRFANECDELLLRIGNLEIGHECA